MTRRSGTISYQPGRRTRRAGGVLVVVCLLTLISCHRDNVIIDDPDRSTLTTEPSPQIRARDSIDESIADGVAFLVSHQNDDGSWGTGKKTHGNEVYHSVPGSHHAFRSAVTGLAVMALRECGETDASNRGIEFLVNDRSARRQEGALIYNVWSHAYALQALAIEMRQNADPRLRVAAEWNLDRLKRYETYIGGWNYYDFVAQTQQPAMGPTSFCTAGALTALWEARRSGIDVPQNLIDRAVRRLEDMRLPGGGYAYSQDSTWHPVAEHNLPRGSVGRSQASNYALLLWGSKKVDVTIAADELPRFFEMQKYLEMGRKKPIPHESWYATAGYYFYFGHYYTARMMNALPEESAGHFGPKLAGLLLPLQEPDGSWWDYPIWDYDKVYGTAFAVMALNRCK